MGLHQQKRSRAALKEIWKNSRERLHYEGTKALRAAALARVGEDEQAILSYREIVAAEPANLEAWTSLAFLLKIVGRPSEAVEALRKALEVAPTHGEAWWMLADLKTFEFSDSDIAALRGAISSPALPIDDRLRLHFTLGKALEDRKDPQSSFGHYRLGNELRAAQIMHNS